MTSRWFVSFALLVALTFGWAARGSNGILATREPQDYYGFLTDAFLAGQTYLKIAPDPALQDLANPWAGAQGIPRLHDASYFHGRYYLYFGPAPVLLLLLPWRVATGTFLAQGIATLIFGLAGTLLTGALLLWVWRRWFSDLGAGWLALGLLLIAIASRVGVLVEDSSVYHVPITCGFFCLMAALSAVAWALTGTGRRTNLGLGAAGLLWGLTVASRPDYAFSVAALVIPVAYLGTRAGRGPGGMIRLALWAFLPVAVIATILAAYNYVRFGEIAQFGMKYQFTAGDQRFLAFFSPGSLGENLRRYFFSRPLYSAYFPFLVSGEDWGVAFCTPFAFFALALPFTLAARRRPELPGWTPWGLTLAVALVPNVLLLCVLAIANERYFIDFLPLTMLLSVVSAWGLLRAGRPGRGPRLRLTQLAVLGFGLWTIGQGTLMMLHSYANPAALRPLAQVADQVSADVESRAGTGQGPMLVRVRFPVRPPGTREPLLVSGHGNDILYVEYPTSGRIQLGFFHTGSGGPIGEPIAFTPGKSYELKLDLGSLYPPKEHPLLASWPDSLADVLLHRLEVTLDGRIVLQGAEAYYPTYPGDVHLGVNPGRIYAPGRFTGELTVVAREGVPAEASLRGPPGQGPVHLVVRIPPFQTFLREPLISTGHRGFGDLLYIAYVAPGFIRLGHDSWGGGSLETAPLRYDASQQQTIDADLPSLSPMATTRLVGMLALRFNGRLVMFTPRPFNASPAAEVVFGFNGCNSSASAATFSGEIIQAGRRGAIEPPPPIGTGRGPVNLVLRFPEDHTTYNQPLLATGTRDAGDLIFVHYLDNHRISLGYTHGGSRILMTRPIAVDYGATHSMDLSLGSLYPAAWHRDWGGVPGLRRQQALSHAFVILDGETALFADQTAFPSDPAGVVAGKDSIGAPDCEPAFSGIIYLQQRLEMGAALPPDVQDGIGPIRLTLRFPAIRPGRSEPLLVTGRAGSGDVLYVHYVDDRHLSLGYDHWNAGGPLSAPIAVDYETTHVLDLSLGSLYPAVGDPAWGAVPVDRQRTLLGAVSISLDGRQVLRTIQTAYRASPAEITPAVNGIGASTSDPNFTGEVIAERRLAPDAASVP